MTNNRNKVVQISSVHPSNDTRIFYKICKSLVEQEYSVDLIIQHPKDEILDGVNIKALPIAKRKSDRLIKIIPILFFKCLAYKRKTIFHFHDPELIPMGIMLKFFGYKVIYDVHEDVPKDILSKDWIPTYLRKLIANVVSSIEIIGAWFFDYIITVTTSIGAKFPLDKTVLVQNFPILNGDSLPLLKAEDKFSHIFYIGDITYIRGLKHVIKALEIVNKTRNVRLFLGGRYSPLSFKEDLEKESGFNYVDFIGWVSRDEIIKYTSKSFAGIVTFLPLPNHIDAQPNKLFEYMYYGLPVIGSDFPLWGEIIEKNDCGILVDPLNPDEIAKAIIKLNSDIQSGLEMGKRGRNVVEKKFNWKHEEVELLRIYSILNV